MTTSISDAFTNAPAIVKWNIVRGDTAKLKIEFLENDEQTYFDISSWTFASTTYDYVGDVLDQLQVQKGTGYVEIIAPASITSLWGTGYNSVVAELAFDLQATIGDQIWTPVLGTIKVSADITSGRL